jgi:hypothetical protein
MFETSGFLLGLGRTVLNLLLAEGFDAVIAGGAARDVYSGRTLKDVDIFVVDRTSGNRLDTILSSIEMRPVGESYEQVELPTLIKSVWKYLGKDGIDVIVINPDLCPSTTEYVLNHFDCNMNQCMFENARGRTGVIQLRGFDKVAKLMTTNVTERRVLHLIEIAEEIGWDATELHEWVTKHRATQVIPPAI